MLAPLENLIKTPEPLSDLLEFDRQLKIIDIGAMLCGPVGYADLLRLGLCTVVGFEPQAVELAKLKAKAGPHETYLPHVIGDGGPGVMHQCFLGELSSLLRPIPFQMTKLNQHDALSEVVATFPVQTVRLADIPEVRGADFLKVDTQGSELTVLENANLSDVLAVAVEVSFFPLYEGQPPFRDVDRFMAASGFYLHGLRPTIWGLAPAIIDGDSRKGTNQVVTADAIYIRNVLSDDQAKALVFLAHYVFRSYDLALSLLFGKAQRQYANLLNGIV